MSRSQAKALFNILNSLPSSHSFDDTDDIDADEILKMSEEDTENYDALVSTTDTSLYTLLSHYVD